MIRLACTNCKTVLSIDDAFAGGVCRCQHCGTIQTVPTTKAGVIGSSAGVQKAIYQGAKSDSASLDELADVVASSGLSGSGLTSRRLTKPVMAAPAPAAKSQLPIFIVAGAVILILLIVIVWLVMRPSAPLAATAPPTISANNPTASISQPSICGIPLNVSSVVYLLDRGSATQEYFAALKDATIKSATSLGSNRKFQIIFWAGSSDVDDPTSYPQDSTTYATADNVTSAQRAIDDIYASGASDAKPAFRKAILRHPDTIVIATAKGYAIDDAWVQAILELRGSAATTVDVLNLGSDSSSAVLKSLADKTGGTYVDLDSNTLRTFAGH